MKHVTLLMGQYSYSPGPGAFQIGVSIHPTDQAYYWTREGIRKAQYPRRMWVQLFDTEEAALLDTPHADEWTQVSTVCGRFVGFFQIIHAPAAEREAS